MASDDFVEVGNVLVDRDGNVGLLFELKAVIVAEPLLVGAMVDPEVGV